MAEIRSIVYYGHIDPTGRMHIRNRKGFDQQVRQMARTDGKERAVEIEVRFSKSYRSGSQNAYYWGVVIPYSQQGFRDLWGEHMSPEDVHHHFRKIFLVRTRVAIKGTGEMMSFLGSTSDLSKTEFAEYIEDVRDWVKCNLDVDIPDPDKNYVKKDKI